MAVDLGSLNREKTSTWSRPRESAAEIAVPPEDFHLNSPRDRGAETHDPAEVVGRAQDAPGGHFEHFEGFQKSPALADHHNARSDPGRPGLPDYHTQVPSRKDLRLEVLPPLPHLPYQQQPRLQQRLRQGSLPSVSQYSPLNHHHHQNQAHLEHRPSHSQPQSLPALSPRQDQFTLSPPNPHPHPHPHPHQHWVPASPRQRRVLPHTDPHFISHDPKHTATPAQSQPDLSFSSFSPERAQLPHLQTRYPPDSHAPFTPIRGHPNYSRVEPDGSPYSRDTLEAPCIPSHPSEQIPANVVTTRRQRSLPNTPITPNSPSYPGPRWDSLPVRRQNSLGQHTSAGLARTTNVPVASDSGIPPSPIRSPQSATFSAGLYSHPQIPEDQALDLNLDSTDTNRHEHAAAVTPGSPSKMYRPDSRQSGETAYSVATDSYNFSRPRKPSLGSFNRPDFSAPLYLRPGTANTSNSDSARLESRTMASNYIPYSAGPRPVRQPSVASNMSSSTFASAAPSLYNKPSYDRLGAAPRNVSQNSATGNYMGLPHAVRPPSPPRNGSGPWAQHPYLDEDEMRSSMRSQLTTSTGQDTLFTEPERSSVQTKTSSIFSTGNRNRNSPFFGPHSPSIEIRESLSVDDVMGMYEQGFNDSEMDLFRRKSSVDPDVPVVRLAPGGMDDQDESRPGSAVSHNSEAASRLIEAMNQPSSIAIPGRSFPLNADGAVHLRDTKAFFRKSLASSLPKDMRLSYINAEQKETGIVDFEKQDDDEERFEADSVRHSRHDSGKEVGPHDEYPSIDALEKVDSSLPTTDSTPTLPDKETLSPLSPTSTEPKIDIMPAPPQPVQGAMQPEDLDPNANDRYGFRKSNQYVTRQQYDDWNGQYSEYLARRRKKWEGFLKENGLMTDHPNRFPQHSAKAKRFIRKGIPPEWRGAAWFYYAGGPKILANNRGVYDNLVKKAQNGELKEVCRDDIERDLYRTFPDNVRFRRSAPSTGLTPGQASQSPSPGNTPVHSRNNSTQSANPTPKAPGSEPAIIESLRRVLSAFAIFNPSIGYCQSLNFLGGMLLLFVESEEQAFWLLNIITRVYLPGTHEMNLEGSKVDLSVLMNELEAVLPNVWSKISDDGSGATKKKSRRARYHRHAVSVSGDNLPPVTLALTAWFMSCFIGTLPIETTLRVWDVFFYEGSKTLFRVALAIFKAGENEIKSISDPMEVFAVVQSLPRKMVDANQFMDICFKKRSGLNHLTSDAIDQQRTERKEKLQIQRKEAVAAAEAAPGIATAATIAVSRTRNADMLSVTSGDSSSVRRKHTLFGRRHKERSLEV